jgi:hypothetical protein
LVVPRVRSSLLAALSVVAHLSLLVVVPLHLRHKDLDELVDLWSVEDIEAQSCGV